MKQIIVCCVLTALMTTMVLGTTGTKTLEATFRNIKVIVDGKEVAMQDPNGNPIEPFIVNGTTYLPVRAVSEALGREVSWVESVNSIIIGGAPSASQSPAPTSTPAPTAEPVKTPAPAPSPSPTPEPAEDKIYTYGESFYFDKFQITVNDAIRWLDGVAKVPVVLTNIDTESSVLSRANCTIYGPNGDMIAHLSNYEEDLFAYGKLQPDSFANLYMYIKHSDTGDYTIEFKKDKEKKVVKLFITQPKN